MTTANLLAKYSIPGPRYTSYPTVPYWQQTPTQDQWISTLQQSVAEGKTNNVGAAIYLHIPFCTSLCTYCGCNNRVTNNRSLVKPYVSALLKELELYRRHLNHTALPVSEIHLGGGSPTFLTAEELYELLSGVLEKIEVQPDAEFSIEADPRTTTLEQLSVLSKLGFKRLSLGVQDFDPAVQKIANREQSEALVKKISEQARNVGFQSINFDLIYGLPLQTEQSIHQTLEAVRRLRPDRIAFYAYAHVPWIHRNQRGFDEKDLPAPAQKRRLYELGRILLEQAGYREIGMDHFALETDSLWKASRDRHLHRNFMGYTARQVSPLIGLGVSSIGDSWRAFAQNEKTLETYQKRLEKNELPLMKGHLLTEEDLVLRRHILNLMTSLETQWDAHDRQTPYLAKVPERLMELCRDGLVELRDNSCRILPEGRPFIRNICMAFDARLTRSAPQTELFSKTL